MTELRSLSPADEACLCRACPSTQKGGTLVAEDVHDLEAHEQRLAQPDSYRPAGCPRCGSKLHIHDLRPRGLHGEPAMATEVLRFRCSDRARCGAGWQVLPAFLARCLWGSWARVACALAGEHRSPVPRRTRRRWRARLAGTARMLVGVLSTASEAGAWVALARAVGLDARRIDVLRGYAVHTGCFEAFIPSACFAELAAAVHRLCPGVRLM